MRAPSVPFVCHEKLINPYGTWASVPFPRSEFKELRKQWRQAKKEQEEQERQAQAEHEAQMQAMQGISPLGMGMGNAVGISGMPSMPSMMPMRSPLTQPVHHPQHAAPYGYPSRELEHHRANMHRRMSIAEPYPDPHSHHAMNAHMYTPAHTHAHGYGSPSGYPLNAPGHALDARYPPPSPAEEPSHALRFGAQHPHETEENIQVLAQQYRQPPYGAQPPAPWQQQGQSHGQHELRHHASHPQMGMSNAQRPVHPYYTVHPNASPNLPTHAAPGHTVLPPLAQSVPNYAPGLAGASSSSTDLPALAAHTSLGRNQLPPDSTLLTPLPGYEPDPEVARLMEAQQRYTQGDDQDDGYSRDGPVDRYFD